MKLTDTQLDIAELTAALAEARKANQRLSNDLQRQSEIIAALRNEIATKDERITELETSVQDYTAHYQHEATHNGLRMIEIGGLKKRITELEAQLAAVLATVEHATEADGRDYSDGCGL